MYKANHFTWTNEHYIKEIDSKFETETENTQMKQEKKNDRVTFYYFCTQHPHGCMAALKIENIDPINSNTHHLNDLRSNDREKKMNVTIYDIHNH